MDRLVAFGCSSQSTWPQIVSNKLGMECTNANTTTTSNRLIMHEIINFPLLATDTVIVVWANPDTKDILYNKDDYKIMNNHYISYTRLYLEKHNLPNLHITSSQDIDHPLIYDIDWSSIESQEELANRIYKRMTEG